MDIRYVYHVSVLGYYLIRYVFFVEMVSFFFFDMICVFCAYLFVIDNVAWRHYYRLSMLTMKGDIVYG